jgi:hypothetical protein
MNPQPNDQPNVFSNTVKNISDSITGVKNSIQNSINAFSVQQPSEPPTSTFNFSNTIIAKFAFIVLVLIVFMFLINLGIAMILYFTAPSNNPYLVKGVLSGNQSLTIPQDPKNSKSITIMRSNNESKGIEFTWSVWIYIDDLNVNSTEKERYSHIFNKGNNQYDEVTNIANINNGPGLYLGPGGNNNLRIIMDTVNPKDTNNVIDITNIPIKKWVNLMIRMENKILDVYVNGTISARLVLDNVPKQNYNDVFICQNGGFSGKISDLRYFSSALNVFDINTIVTYGPSLSATKSVTNDNKFFSQYLSNIWYNSKL